MKVTATESCGLCWTAETSVSADGVPYLYVHYADLEITGQSLPGMFRIQLPGLLKGQFVVVQTESTLMTTCQHLIVDGNGCDSSCTCLSRAFSRKR